LHELGLVVPWVGLLAKGLSDIEFKTRMGKDDDWRSPHPFVKAA